MVPLLALVGYLFGLVLSIVPRLTTRLCRGSRRAVRCSVDAAAVAGWILFGVWTYHSMGVTYARDLAVYNRALAADELGGMETSPIDGRLGWILVWAVAGLVAYWYRPGARHLVLESVAEPVMQWHEGRTTDH